MKRRSSSTIPFGYKLMEDGVHLEEIEDELKALNKIVPLVKIKFSRCVKEPHGLNMIRDAQSHTQD